MATLRPRYAKDEFALRGQALFEREVLPQIQEADAGAFVAIDIETASFEIDRDDRAATDRLLARVPDAQIWVSRVGHRAAYRLGGRPLDRAVR